MFMESSGGTDAMLTVPDIARTLSVSKNTVYRLIADGELPAFKIGAQVRVKASDADEFLTKMATHQQAILA